MIHDNLEGMIHDNRLLSSVQKIYCLKLSRKRRGKACLSLKIKVSGMTVNTKQKGIDISG